MDTAIGPWKAEIRGQGCPEAGLVRDEAGHTGRVSSGDLIRLSSPRPLREDFRTGDVNGILVYGGEVGDCRAMLGFSECADLPLVQIKRGQLSDRSLGLELARMGVREH